MSATAERRPAVVLLSGGLDSATCLAIAKSEGFAAHAISFRYGQRHQYELDCARALSEQLGAVSHRVVDINLAQFGGSALTDAAIDVPKCDSVDAMATGIPVTYVPARNTVFLSLALALAETLDCRDLFVGVNALDYSGYPDCRPAFIEAFERMANLATKIGVEQPGAIRIHAPLLHWTKAQIIAKGIELGVDYAHTNSCYDPGQDGAACGRCDACLLRRKGFEENGLRDPG